MGCATSRASHVSMRPYHNMVTKDIDTDKMTRGQPDGEEKFRESNCEY